MVLLLAAVVMALGALAVLALGTAALLDLGPFAPPETPRGLEVDDPLGDCREARLDRGAACEAGDGAPRLSGQRPLSGTPLGVRVGRPVPVVRPATRRPHRRRAAGE